MEALDGNAIAGLLYEVFGEEMTTAVGVCAHCGADDRVGAMHVFLRAPGTIVRCAHCGNVVMAFVSVRNVVSVDMRGLRELDATAR
jgi:ribosomal protein S27AE